MSRRNLKSTKTSVFCQKCEERRVGELAFLWLGKEELERCCPHSSSQDCGLRAHLGQVGRELVGTTADASVHTGCWALSQLFNCLTLRGAGERWAQMQTHTGESRPVSVTLPRGAEEALENRSRGESLGGFGEEVRLERWHRQRRQLASG